MVWFAVLAWVDGARAEQPGSIALATLAHVVAPGGRSFTTEIVSLADGSLRMVQTHPDQVWACVVLPGSGTVWSREGADGAWTESGSEVAEFARGHDVHRIYLEASPAAPDSLALEIPEALGGGTVLLRFRERRGSVVGDIPAIVGFLHEGELYTYHFRHILPFHLAPGPELPSEPGLLFDRLGDLHALATAHESVLQAHRDSDVADIMEGEAPEGITSSRGRLSAATREQTGERLGPYLSRTRFERYEDVEVPVLSVSADGTVGWVACEIEASGVQREADGTATPLEFGFSWVELMAKQDGRWLRVGNASSARD